MSDKKMTASEWGKYMASRRKTKATPFSDPEKAKAAVKKRWENYAKNHQETTDPSAEA